MVPGTVEILARRFGRRAVFAAAGLGVAFVALVLATYAAFLWLSAGMPPIFAASVLAVVYALISAALLWLALRNRTGWTAERQTRRTLDDERAMQILESYLAGRRIAEALRGRRG